MLIGRVESGEDLHHIVDFLLFFGPSFIKTNLFPKVQEFARYNEFFPFDPFIEFMVVDIDKSKLHSLFFFCILVIEFHFCEKKLSIVVVLNLEVSSLWHETDYFSWIVPCFVGLVYSESRTIYLYP